MHREGEALADGARVSFAADVEALVERRQHELHLEERQGPAGTQARPGAERYVRRGLVGHGPGGDQLAQPGTQLGQGAVQPVVGP